MMNSTVAIRLHEGDDLKKSIEEIAMENTIEAGCILSLVGSLHVAVLRMAGAKEVKTWSDGHYEIVSATGTLSQNGSHIHISISDERGNVFGGHLKEGCIVNTTVELIIGILPDFIFSRSPDTTTGFDELKIERKS